MDEQTTVWRVVSKKGEGIYQALRPWHYVNRHGNEKPTLYEDKPLLEKVKNFFGSLYEDGTATNLFMTGAFPRSIRDPEVPKKLLAAPELDRDNWRYGFISKEQYLNWFDVPEVRKSLEKEGAKVVKYEVPKDFVLSSNQQAIFFPDVAKKKKTVKISTFHKELVKNGFEV